jgi:hypothetical protein
MSGMGAIETHVTSGNLTSKSGFARVTRSQPGNNCSPADVGHHLLVPYRLGRKVPDGSGTMDHVVGSVLFERALCEQSSESALAAKERVSGHGPSAADVEIN